MGRRTRRPVPPAQKTSRVVLTAFLFILAAGAGFLVRSRLKRSQAPAPAPADADMPGKDEAFSVLDVFADSRLLSYVRTSYDTEGEYVQRPPVPVIEGGSAILEAPPEIPASWDDDVRGFGLRHGKVQGDLIAETVVDLAKSRLSPGRANAPSVFSFALRTLWGADAEGWFWLDYSAPTGRSAEGSLKAVAGQREPVTFAAPKGAKVMRLCLTRRGAATTASAAFDGGPLKTVTSWEVPEAAGPIRGVNVAAQAYRPEGVSNDAPYRVPGKDRYVVTSLRLTCIDRDGCTIRYRD